MQGPSAMCVCRRTVGQGLSRTIGASACPAATSYGPDQLGDICLTHGVEVVWHLEPMRQKAQTSLHRRLGRGQGRHLDHGLAGLGDDKGLATRRFLDKTRQVRWGFMDVEGVHGARGELVQWC